MPRKNSQGQTINKDGTVRKKAKRNNKPLALRELLRRSPVGTVLYFECTDNIITAKIQRLKMKVKTERIIAVETPKGRENEMLAHPLTKVTILLNEEIEKSS